MPRGGKRMWFFDAKPESLSYGMPVLVVAFEGGASFEYHNDPEKTASSRHPKGWSTLGDVGYLDDDNFLFLTDRLGISAR